MIGSLVLFSFLLWIYFCFFDSEHEHESILPSDLGRLLAGRVDVVCFHFFLLDFSFPSVSRFRIHTSFSLSMMVPWSLVYMYQFLFFLRLSKCYRVASPMLPEKMDFFAIMMWGLREGSIGIRPHPTLVDQPIDRELALVKNDRSTRDRRRHGSPLSLIKRVHDARS